MNWASLQDVADKQVLHLRTIGRSTGLAREIEIWFVVYRDRFYLFAETGEAAAWVKNIRRNREVGVRIGDAKVTSSRYSQFQRGPGWAPINLLHQISGNLLYSSLCSFLCQIGAD